MVVASTIKCSRLSAEGARYNSQGQARSASPLDRSTYLAVEP